MTRPKLSKLHQLEYEFDMLRSLLEEHYTHEQFNASMKEIRTRAEKLQQKTTDEETRKRVAWLIQSCNEAIYSHKVYVEHEQFLVLEIYDTKKKFVVIDTSFGVKDCRILVCEYDDAMQNGKAVLNNDYLISIKISHQTYYEVHQLIDQVRKDSGESTLLYGHKKVHTCTTWVNY